MNPDNLKGTLFFDIEEISIAEFHPLPHGQGKATQVHMLIKVRGVEHSFIMRFKGRKALDAVVAALTEHADAVFGEKP